MGVSRRRDILQARHERLIAAWRGAMERLRAAKAPRRFVKFTKQDCASLKKHFGITDQELITEIEVAVSAYRDTATRTHRSKAESYEALLRIWRAIAELEIALVETTPALGSANLTWPAILAGSRFDPTTGKVSPAVLPSLPVVEFANVLASFQRTFVEPRAMYYKGLARPGRPKRPPVWALYSKLRDIYLRANPEPAAEARDAKAARQEVLRMLRAVCKMADLHIPKNVTVRLLK